MILPLLPVDQVFQGHGNHEDPDTRERDGQETSEYYILPQ
jgi:hypothetical protein